MDKRWFFIVGDLLANIVAGLFVAWVCYLIVDQGWNMFLAMVLCMALGMILSLFIWIPAGIFLGAMELMLPVMLSGMYSGMVVGMMAAMHPLTLDQAMLTGAFIGLATIILIWLINTRLRGIQSTIR